MNKWISTKDKMPKPYETVLVYVKERKYKGVDIGEYDKEFGEWNLNTNYSCKYKVTHWAPLPDVPKED